MNVCYNAADLPRRLVKPRGILCDNVSSVRLSLLVPFSGWHPKFWGRRITSAQSAASCTQPRPAAVSPKRVVSAHCRRSQTPATLPQLGDNTCQGSKQPWQVHAIERKEGLRGTATSTNDTRRVSVGRPTTLPHALVFGDSEIEVRMPRFAEETAITPR